MAHQNELNNFLFDGASGAWVAKLTSDHFKTAILHKMAEFIDSGVTWEWWLPQKDPSLFDNFESKMKIIEVVFFYLSLMVIKAYDGKDNCSSNVEFTDYGDYYIGTDRGINNAGVGLLLNTNSLDHSNFIGLFKETCQDHETVFEMIEILDLIVSSGGFSSEHMSAFYSAKWVLDKTREESPSYEVSVAGVTDNERLEPLVDAFLNDKDMTLETLRQNVVDEFFSFPTNP